MCARSFIRATRMMHSVIRLEVCRPWALVRAPLVTDPYTPRQDGTRLQGTNLA